MLRNPAGCPQSNDWDEVMFWSAWPERVFSPRFLFRVFFHRSCDIKFAPARTWQKRLVSVQDTAFLSFSGEGLGFWSEKKPTLPAVLRRSTECISRNESSGSQRQHVQPLSSALMSNWNQVLWGWGCVVSLSGTCWSEKENNVYKQSSISDWTNRRQTTTHAKIQVKHSS